MSDLPAEHNAIPAVPSTRVHLSDAEFRNEMIYFVVLDRFNHGETGRSPQADELEDTSRQDWGKYWGGNLQGLVDKLDYLQSMGVTAVWVTPLFEQVDALADSRAPLHGYWTRDFKRINDRWVNDPSEVSLFRRNDTIFDTLITELHRRGMKLILDIVCNHSSPETTKGKGLLYDDGELIADFNNDTQNWYHHYGEVTNWEDEWQIQNCELAGLATFNENNVLYRNYIKSAIKLWLDKGVDALRIDTIKHMPLWFWQEFNADMQSHKPGIFIFGEWIFNHPLNESSVQFANQGGLSLLDFGLCVAIRQCLGENRAEGFKIVQELLSHDGRYRGATELVTFFENHDMPRLQSLNPDPAALHLALVLLLTTRGIPCLYYGCEQYLHNDSEGGNDPYNRPMMEHWDDTEAKRLIKILSEERAQSRALQWGGHWTKAVESDFYVYLRRYCDSRCLVILNRSEDGEKSFEAVEFPDGRHLCLLTGREVEIADQKVTVALKKNEALVLSVRGEPQTGTNLAHIQVNGAPTQLGEKLAIIGDCPELGQWDLRKAYELECINSNTWFAEVPFDASSGRPVAYKYVIFNNEGIPRREIHTARRRSLPTSGISKWRDIWEE